VAVCKRLPSPWRSVVDGGVVVGLSWGVSSVLLLYLKQKFFGGLPTRADPCLPASAAQAKGQ
jgi:hypothetical protein